MSHAESLIQKLRNKTAVLGVIGLGYVGLPLAVETAKAGYRVIGFDDQKSKVDLINQGFNYIVDVNALELRKLVDNRGLYATTNYEFITDVDAIFICVPTPLDCNGQPDISEIVNSVVNVAKRLHKGMLVILESTTYPGTTQNVCLPLLEKESGLKCGSDFFLVFSPERIDPGNHSFKINNIPKVIGGITKECTQIASILYQIVLKSMTIEVSSPAVAEMVKILENTFRNVNIALVNEMAVLCSRNKMNIDIWEVIEAAKTKPFGFMSFYPGPGIGGHCIPIDPAYIEWKAREYDYEFKLIRTASSINDLMPQFVTDNIARLLNMKKKQINGSKVLILGVAYKKDIDDYRESPTLKVIRHLEDKGAEIIVNDPFVTDFMLDGKKYITKRWDDYIGFVDIVVIMTDHTCYDYETIAVKSNLVYDTRNATKDIIGNREKIYTL